MRFVDKIYDESELLIYDFIKKYNELGMRATGEWADSLEINVSGFTFQILGKDYTQYLTNGRGSGNKPPIDNLKRWVTAKFGYTDDRQVTGAAFAIANKIANEGTTWYKQGGSDLIDGVLTQQREQQIINNVGQEILTSISEDVQRAIFA